MSSNINVMCIEQTRPKPRRYVKNSSSDIMNRDLLKYFSNHKCFKVVWVEILIKIKKKLAMVIALVVSYQNYCIEFLISKRGSETICGKEVVLFFLIDNFKVN